MTIHDHQVLQRGADGTAHGLPLGGPYETEGASDVLVGDLWVLGGQSNMEGVGDLTQLETPSPMVHSYQSREDWAVAEEPLHWLDESPRIVHHQILGRDTLQARLQPRDPSRVKGAGLGLTFGKTYHALTGVPVGLIPSAHGGTSMAQWDPALKDRGDASLYGATLARVHDLGGKVRGILWYQGESDANPSDAARYPERMQALINAFRTDLGQPDLPFYLVQLGCFEQAPSADGVAGWNAIREAQRVLAQSLPQVGTVTAIDLELDDAIHIGVLGLKRLGRRLASVAAGRPALTFAGVTVEDGGARLRVTCENVRGGLCSAGRPAGFTLRDVQGEPYEGIYKITLEGNTAVLHIERWGGPLPPSLHLWYGYGLHPYCNITDDDDQAVPAFGPVPIPQS